MLIALHKHVRREIAQSTESVADCARRYGISEPTVRKWRNRIDFNDRSHTPHDLQTTLSEAQEAIVVYLRKKLLLSLDDLLAVTREFICSDVSRSGLSRCLRRHGVSNLRKLKPLAEKPTHKPFKAYLPGYLHIDVKYLPQMADETKRRYLFVAIDRATRWVYIAFKPNKTAAAAREFLAELYNACPIKIVKILTDNGKEFTDRLFASSEREASGNHEFDRLCEALGIEHRLTKPRHPQTNGMVERFNGRISDILKTHRFHSGEDLETTLHRYVFLYNHHLPQTALESKTPFQAMKIWYTSNPECFVRNPDDALNNHPAHDMPCRAASMPELRKHNDDSTQGASPAAVTGRNKLLEAQEKLILIARILRTIAVLGMLGTLAACGGGGAGGGGAGGGGAGGGTTATATLTLALTDKEGNAITHVSGAQSGTAVATVRDARGNAVAGALVTYSTDARFGTFDPPSGTALTDASGRASVTLRPGNTDGAAQLSATGVFRSGGVDVSVSNAINYSSIAGVGAAPSVTVSAPQFGVNRLSAYGTTSVTVTVAGASTPLRVSFNSVCAQLNRATITPSAETINGTATASYRDNGCASSDTITATVMSGVSSSATLEVQAPTVGSIQFLSANPNHIVLRETGGAGRPETSTVRFRVLDQGGNPIARRVDFLLTTNVGGLELTNLTAQSDARTGEVQTTVRAGTVPTPVRVQATVAGANLTTLSDQLSISSGYPDQAHFSLSVSTFNIEGWEYDGETTALTVRLADHFSNPVPDGTVVNFIAEGGQIGGTCSTAGSLCTVNFTSQALRPDDGRVSVLAYAIGNEAFTDRNGNGLVNEGAERVDANGLSTDRPEAWIDYNENGVRDLDEPFVDFNGNGGYDAGDDLYTGVLCRGGPSLCSSARNPPQTTLHIFNQAVIVLSGSEALIDFYDTDLNEISEVNLGGCTTPQAERTVYALIRDRRGNPMPAGTRVTASTSNGTLVQGASQLVPNSSAQFTRDNRLPAFLYRFDIRNDASGSPCTDLTATGTLRVTVQTPKNISTIKSLDVKG